MIEQTWRKEFTEREVKEMDFSELYAKDFHHGTEGHNAKLIIAKLVALIDLEAGVTKKGTD